MHIILPTLLFILISLTMSLTTISSLYDIEDYEHPYSHLEEASGVILTSDPTPAAYVDKLFIPIYFDIYQGYEAFLLHDAEYILYKDESYPCEVYKNPERCEKVKKKFLMAILNRIE